MRFARRRTRWPGWRLPTSISTLTGSTRWHRRSCGILPSPRSIRRNAPGCSLDFSREQPLLLNVVLRDRSGALVASGAEAPADRTSTPAPAYLLEVLETGQPAVSDLYCRASDRQPDDRSGVPGARRRRHGCRRARLEPQPAAAAAGIRQPGASGWLRRHAARSEGTDSRPQSRRRTIHRPDDRGRGGAACSRRRPRCRSTSMASSGSSAPRSVNRGPWSLSVGIPRPSSRDRLAPLWCAESRYQRFGRAGCPLALAPGCRITPAMGLNRLRSAAQRIAGGDLSPPDADRRSEPGNR